jgi:cytochrome c556
MRFASLLLLAGLAVAQSPQYTPVASTKQIMAALVKPSMDGIGATVKAGGPKDEKEWEVVQRNAAMLAEAAQLLELGNRPPDHDGWTKASHKLQELAEASAKAAQSKDAEAFKTAAGNIGASCKGCHSVYRKKS